MIFDEVKLKDIATIFNGRAYKQNELLENGKYKVLRVGNFFTSDSWYFSNLELDENKYCNFGDLLFAWSANFGPKIWNEGKTIFHYHIWKIELKENIDKNYLFYYLKFITDKLKNSTHGSVMMHLTKVDMENQIIKLPDYNNQKKIGEILSKIDEKIELNNQINDNLYKILEQYIKEHYYNNESVLNGIVSNVGKIQGGYAFKSKDLLDEPTNNKIFKIKNISESSVDIENTQCIYDEIAYKVDKKFLLVRGNVIIAMTGAELGKTGYLYGKDYRYFLNQRVGVIRGNDKYSELYLNCLFLLKDMQNTLNSKGYGSAQPNISTSDIENIEIPIPNEDDLKTFYEVCNPIYNKMILNSEQNQSLTQLRDTLLPKLMNGEINIDNIEV